MSEANEDQSAHVADVPAPDKDGYWTRTPAGGLYYHANDPAREDDDLAAHVEDSHELRETEDERRENEFIVWQAAYMESNSSPPETRHPYDTIPDDYLAAHVADEVRSTPRWAHTALIELTRQGREHPTWISAGWWDDIIARAEDMAEADGSTYVHEQHVVLARRAKEAPDA